jgi:hypothetical protein
LLAAGRTTEEIDELFYWRTEAYKIAYPKL